MATSFLVSIFPHLLFNFFPSKSLNKIETSYMDSTEISVSTVIGKSDKF